MTTELVGPLSTIRFQDGSRQAYSPPKNTLDPRYRACINHHPACDCREAQAAEDRAEHVTYVREIETVARDILTGHPTYAWEDGPDGEREAGCACTGCQIVRAAGLLFSALSPMARDEVHGLSWEQVDAGYRWTVCIQQDRGKHGRDCAKVQSRDRGVYHEHLVGPSGLPTWLPEFDPSFECPF